MGPVFGQNAAGFGPCVGGVELEMPLKCPKFLNSEPSNGPIQEQSIDALVVPVHTEGPHAGTIAAPPAWRRREEFFRVTVGHCAVEKHGDVGLAPERVNSYAGQLIPPTRPNGDGRIEITTE